MYTTANTKRFVAPKDAAGLPPSHTPYCNRPDSEAGRSYLEWLREHREQGSVAHGTYRVTKYQRSSSENWLMAVGVRYRKIKSDRFFWQWLLMNVPHRSPADLQSPWGQRVSSTMQWFAAACWHCPEQWGSDTWVRSHLELQGHRVDFVQSTVARLAADRWLIQQQLDAHVPRGRGDGNTDPGPELALAFADLTTEQAAIYNELVSDWRTRQGLALDSEESLQNFAAEQRPRFVTGYPGSGKSFVVSKFAATVLEQGGSVLIATPAARLGNVYRSVLQNATVAAVHQAFAVPVASTSPESWPINGALQRFDLIVVDEASLLTQGIFEHIIRSWLDVSRIPMLLFVGDFQQLPPVERAAGDARSSPAWGQVQQTVLTQQVRCEDEDLMSFLTCARDERPSWDAVNTFSSGIVTSSTDLHTAIVEHPEATVLTASKRACDWANEVAMGHFGAQSTYLGSVPVWRDNGDTQLLHLFEGARVFITYNQSAEKMLMNGEQCVVLALGPDTICVRTAAGGVQCLPMVYHWRTVAGRERLEAGFYIAPAYASTVFKSQGSTLSYAIILIDDGFCHPGLGYVACSRVKMRSQLQFVGCPQPCHFTPVEP